VQRYKKITVKTYKKANFANIFYKTTKKAKKNSRFHCLLHKYFDYQAVNVYSSETVSFFLPFALRAAKTRRPFADDILSRKPCLFLRFLFDG
jgi:hypothetical protein